MVTVLREARIERGLSQTVVAEAIGEKQNTLASWEVGIHPPGLDVVRKWTAYFGLDLKLTGVAEEPADVVYGRGWDDCAAAMAVATRRAAA